MGRALDLLTASEASVAAGFPLGRRYAAVGDVPEFLVQSLPTRLARVRSSGSQQASFWNEDGNTPEHYSAPSADEPQSESQEAATHAHKPTPVGNNGTVTKEAQVHCVNGNDPLKQGQPGKAVSASGQAWEEDEEHEEEEPGPEHQSEPIAGKTPVDDALLKEFGHGVKSENGGRQTSQLLDSPAEMKEWKREHHSSVLTPEELKAVEEAGGRGKGARGSRAALLDVDAGRAEALPSGRRATGRAASSTAFDDDGEESKWERAKKHAKKAHEWTKKKAAKVKEKWKKRHEKDGDKDEEKGATGGKADSDDEGDDKDDSGGKDDEGEKEGGKKKRIGFLDLFKTKKKDTSHLAFLERLVEPSALDHLGSGTATEAKLLERAVHALAGGKRGFAHVAIAPGAGQGQPSVRMLASGFPLPELALAPAWGPLLGAAHDKAGQQHARRLQCHFL